MNIVCCVCVCVFVFACVCVCVCLCVHVCCVYMCVVCTYCCILMEVMFMFRVSFHWTLFSLSEWRGNQFRVPDAPQQVVRTIVQ